VTLPGGDLGIEWRESDDHVLMTGPVAYEFEGHFDPALFAGPHATTSPLDGFGVGAFAAIPGVRSVKHHAGEERASLELILQEEQVIASVIAVMEANRITLLSLTKHQPTLEDVFVQLVGRSMQEVEILDEPALI